MPKTALFVIDIQNEMAGEGFSTAIPHAKRIRTTAAEILNRARNAVDSAHKKSQSPPLELVFVQHEEFSETGGGLIRDTEPWKLVFNPREEESVPAEKLVAKTDGRKLRRHISVTDRQLVGDVFESNPDLAADLRAEGVEVIVTFGIQSEYCVLATSRGAIKNGFKVKLLHGAHSTYDEGDTGRTALEIEKYVEDELKKDGAEVIAWEEWKP